MRGMRGCVPAYRGWELSTYGNAMRLRMEGFESVDRIRDEIGYFEVAAREGLKEYH